MVLDEHVYSWYREFSVHDQLADEIRNVIRYAVCVLVARLQQVRRGAVAAAASGGWFQPVDRWVKFKIKLHPLDTFVGSRTLPFTRKHIVRDSFLSQALNL